MPDYQNWTLAVEDRIATLTLNRAHVMNRITADTLYELRDITAYIDAQKDIWAVIVQGAGDHFSVGVDVHLIASAVGQEKQAYSEALLKRQQCVDAFEALAKPKIARIRGYCIGGGLIIASCCDFRIVSENARFALPEVKRGIAVVMGTQRITRLVGVAAAKEIILLAEQFDAETAFRYGLVNRVVPDSDLDAAVNELAAKFRHLPPRTVHIARRIIDEGYNMTLRESEDLEIELQSGLLDSRDFKEGVQSFFEKRPPVFTGE